MSFQVQDKSRVTRGGYWFAMLINILACTGLLVGGIIAVVSGEFLLGGLMLFAILPVGIYFRVVMMRRCRDIGWPPSLPWILFGAGIVSNFMNLFSSDPMSAFGSFGLSAMIGLADFLVMLIIGGIRGKTRPDFEEVFGGPSIQPQRMAAAGAAPDFSGSMDAAYRDGDDASSGEHASWDAAIQRALKKQAGGSQPAAPAASAARVAPAPVAAMGARPQAAGFGRKGL